MGLRWSDGGWLGTCKVYFAHYQVGKIDVINLETKLPCMTPQISVQIVARQLPAVDFLFKFILHSSAFMFFLLLKLLPYFNLLCVIPM